MLEPAPGGRQQWQQRAEELSAATLRAMSGDSSLHFRGGHLHQGGHLLPLHAPHLRIDTGAVDYADCRALADAVALRLRYTDKALHEALRPADGIERLVFEWLEQLRVETLVDAALPGQVHNLRHRFERWARDYHRAGLTRGQLGMLMFTLAQMCWSRLTGYPVLEETEEMIEGMRAGLAEPLGTALAGLRRQRSDQAAYAVHALAIAKHVASELPPLRREEDDADSEADEDNEENRARRRFRLLQQPLHFRA